VHEYLDTAGRPVGEGRASIFQELETQMCKCPYPGIRHNHAKPMNASAIQGMPAFSQLLSIMSWLSHRDRKRYGLGVTNSNDLGRITSSGILLVDYLALRRENPIGPKAVPLLVSGVYKVCLGYQLAYLPERFSEGDPPAELPDAAGFLQYLEEGKLLIGEAEVCSCPPMMILQSYEAMTRETATVIAPEISGLTIDWDRFDAFAEAAGEMWHALILFAMRMPDLIPQLDSAELPIDVKERLNRCLSERGTELLEEREGLVVEVAESIRSMRAKPARRLAGGANLPRDIQPGTVAASVIEWLCEKAPDDMAMYGTIAGPAIQSQLGPYENYESQVLMRINTNLNLVMHALDLDAGPAQTDAAALSRICGRTMRDWAIR
jgi:hypothetical protein